MLSSSQNQDIGIEQSNNWTRLYAPDALFDDEEDVVDHAGGEGAILDRVQLHCLADTLGHVVTGKTQGSVERES